jgi:hypothetical protein
MYQMSSVRRWVVYREVFELNGESWMRENAYVTYTKYVSEQSGKIDRNRTTYIGWKIKSLEAVPELISAINNWLFIS